MKIILTFALLMIPGVVSSISVTGYSGGGVMIACKYDEIYTANEKYFCRGDKWPGECSDLIKTNVKYKWFKSGRFALYDNTSSAVFTVMIKNLNQGDSGKFQCGVDISDSKDSYTEVNLKVITDQQNRTVRGYSGGNVIINYKYEEKHMNHVKVCKTGTNPCFTPISTNRTTEWGNSVRFSVHDDRSAGLLHLFIRELNVNDSGEYMIVVKVSEDYRFFFKFDLDIRDDDCCGKSISLSAAAGGSVNISCKYPQSHIDDVKFLCWRSGADLCAEETSVNQSRRWSPEGKILLYDDREEQLLTGSISHVTHSEYWCGVQSDQGHKSFITRVLIRVTDFPKTTSSLLSSSSSSSSSSSVFKTSTINMTSAAPNMLTASFLILPLVLLVLFIVGLLLLFLCKKHRSRGGDSSSQIGPGKLEAVSCTGCVNEEIKDTHKQIPTNPSNSSDCVYATVQKATGDSQCCITSAEDLNYAVVNFQKKSDCPDRVSFRNNHDYTEYAAVNHLTA